MIRLGGMLSIGQDRAWIDGAASTGDKVIRTDDGPLVVGSRLWPTQIGIVNPSWDPPVKLGDSDNTVERFDAATQAQIALWQGDPPQISARGNTFRLEGPLTFDAGLSVQVERSGNGFVELDVTLVQASPGMGLSPGDSWSRSQRRRQDILTWGRNNVNIPAGEWVELQVEFITNDDVIRIVRWWLDITPV